MFSCVDRQCDAMQIGGLDFFECDFLFGCEYRLSQWGGYKNKC